LLDLLAQRPLYHWAWLLDKSPQGWRRNPCMWRSLGCNHCSSLCPPLPYAYRPLPYPHCAHLRFSKAFTLQNCAAEDFMDDQCRRPYRDRTSVLLPYPARPYWFWLRRCPCLGLGVRCRSSRVRAKPETLSFAMLGMQCSDLETVDQGLFCTTRAFHSVSIPTRSSPRCSRTRLWHRFWLKALYIGLSALVVVRSFITFPIRPSLPPAHSPSPHRLYHRLRAATAVPSVHWDASILISRAASLPWQREPYPFPVQVQLHSFSDPGEGQGIMRTWVSHQSLFFIGCGETS